MSASISTEVKAEPNLTPLLDVVFQLITFFMLVINFSKDTYVQGIRLPVAGSARPIEGSQVVEDRLVLNIDSKGRLHFNNTVIGVEEAIREIGLQAEVARLSARRSKLDIKPGDQLPTTIVIRGDSQLKFTYLNRYINACQINGFHKFDFKAMNKIPEAGGGR